MKFTGKFRFDPWVGPWVVALGALVGSAACVNSNPAMVGGALQRSDSHPGITCEELSVPTRDGVSLTTFVYRPEEAGTDRLPSIVVRSPYGFMFREECFAESEYYAQMLKTTDVLVRDGYAYVTQVARGTHTSGGRMQLVAQEGPDGEDLVRWVTAQAWSDGNVGLWGGSYLGITAWQTAASKVPGVRAIVAGVTSADTYAGLFYRHGVPGLSSMLSWPATSFVPDQLMRQGHAAEQSAAETGAAIAARMAVQRESLFAEWAWQLPLTSMPHFRGLVDDYYTWLAHPFYDEYWDGLSVENHIPQIDVPALITGAWYDELVDGTLSSFAQMKTSAASQEARAGTKLVMGVYGHVADPGTPTFGPRMVPVVGPLDLNLRFLERYVKGIENGYEETPAVTLGVMVPPDHGQEGSVFEVTGDRYPLAGTTNQEFFLSSGGRANGRAGDGILSAGPAPHSSVADQFRYDPANPVPTTGGANLCCAEGQYEGGPLFGAREQSSVEQRDDVLVYTSAPLQEDLTIIGPVSMRLFAKSSAPDTDFTAKLVDVRPDGLTHDIVDGILRARLRAGVRSEPSLIEPGQVYEYTIRLGDTATIIPAGHRVRLQVSSSNFPRFARNLNTGLSNETTAKIAIAQQTILHDAQHPSRLILPVASGVERPH